MKELIKQQKSSDKFWQDEAGSAIPYNRTKPYERKAETVLAEIARKAVKLNADLTTFKESIIGQVEALYAAFLIENNGKIGKNKGNATFFNFDRSIKVEVQVNEAIIFDENLITLAKDKLDEVLSDGLEGAKDFVKPLVMEAFETTGGKLDTKRVLGLRRYADRVKDDRYAEAMQLIDKAIRKPSSKEYFRVWLRGKDGEYQDVQLNFSSIKN